MVFRFGSFTVFRIGSCTSFFGSDLSVFRAWILVRFFLIWIMSFQGSDLSSVFLFASRRTKGLGCRGFSSVRICWFSSGFGFVSFADTKMINPSARKDFFRPIFGSARRKKDLPDERADQRCCDGKPNDV